MQNSSITIIESLDRLNEFANNFSQSLKLGDVIFLKGEMGSGKTTLVSAICEKLGSKDKTTSPTYAVKHEYVTDSYTIDHYDLFKVRQGDYLYQMALEDFPNKNSISFVEWPENLPESMQNIFSYQILIQKISDTSRKLNIIIRDGQQ